MATTTPNYGWPVPTSTDLVKDGATAIEALGDAVDSTVFGLGISGAWTSYTPTISNWALGNGTLVAAYKQIGKVVFFRITFTVGSTTTKSGQIIMTLPVTAAAAFDDRYTTSLYLLDSGTDEYSFTSSNSTTNVIGGYQLSGGNNRAVTNTAPFTFTTNDVIRFTGYYEAA